MRHCYIFGFTLPYLANQPITVYTERIKVGQVPPSALSLPASSARPLPGRCLCRSPRSTDRHFRCGRGEAFGSFAYVDRSLAAGLMCVVAVLPRCADPLHPSPSLVGTQTDRTGNRYLDRHGQVRTVESDLGYLATATCDFAATCYFAVTCYFAATCYFAVTCYFAATATLLLLLLPRLGVGVLAAVPGRPVPFCGPCFLLLLHATQCVFRVCGSACTGH